MASTEMIAETLSGLEYPASRNEVILHATGHGAPESILHLLYKLPEREFNSADDLWDEIRRVM